MYSLMVPKENTQDNVQDISIEVERLMDTYGDDVLRTSYMYLKDIYKAEDAFQEVFIKIFKKYKSFKGQSSEKTWIMKITINSCKDMLRSSWLKRVFVTDKIIPYSSDTNIERDLIERDTKKLLFEEVLSLSPEFKEVIILYYYQHLATADISKILEVAEGTVRSRLHRAREILKIKLGEGVDWGE